MKQTPLGCMRHLIVISLLEVLPLASACLCLLSILIFNAALQVLERLTILILVNIAQILIFRQMLPHLSEMLLENICVVKTSLLKNNSFPEIKHVKCLAVGRVRDTLLTVAKLVNTFESVL